MFTSSGNTPNQIKCSRSSSANRCTLKFNDALKLRRFKLASSVVSLAPGRSNVFNRAISLVISCNNTAQSVPLATCAAANSNAKGR